MELLKPDPRAALAGLRAMKRVALAGRDELGVPARALMAAAQRHILRSDHDVDALTPIAPDELAQAMPDAAVRRQLVQAMTVMSVADGMPQPATLDAVRAYARALGVDAPEVDTIRRLADQQLLLFRLDFMRRGHVADMLKDQFRHHGGVMGLVKGVLGLRGYLEDEEVAAPYRSLDRLPKDSFGYAFFQHYRELGFAFPGEKGGFPESGVYHDLTHILAEYDTTPSGEVQVGGFVAGYKQNNPVYVVLFVILTFSAGVNMTPLEQPHIEGILGEPGMAEKFLVAIERGARVPTDLSDHWDFWPLLRLPLDQVRQQLRITPRARSAG